ncbi:MAG: hypothetical protein KJ706_04155 [Candidatus Omnitrophica bacterium]|nr:hypothetical protein [Candidatus Omnitrophota bacterium]
MNNKGFSYYLENDKIIDYLKLSPRMRLEWLEEIDDFNRKALKGKRRIIWEKFRKGEI